MKVATNTYVAVCMFIAATALVCMTVVKQRALPFFMVAVLTTGIAIVLALIARRKDRAPRS